MPQWNNPGQSIWTELSADPWCLKEFVAQVLAKIVQASNDTSLAESRFISLLQLNNSLECCLSETLKSDYLSSWHNVLVVEEINELSLLRIQSHLLTLH